MKETSKILTIKIYLVHYIIPQTIEIYMNIIITIIKMLE